MYYLHRICYENGNRKIFWTLWQYGTIPEWLLLHLMSYQKVKGLLASIDRPLLGAAGSALVQKTLPIIALRIHRVRVLMA